MYKKTEIFLISSLFLYYYYHHYLISKYKFLQLLLLLSLFIKQIQIFALNTKVKFYLKLSVHTSALASHEAHAHHR